MYATSRGFEEIALFLIEEGADLNVVQSSGCATGYTALHWAIQSHMNKVIQAMIKQGVDFYNSKTPLWPALYKSDIIKILVEEGNIKVDLAFYRYVEKTLAEYDSTDENNQYYQEQLNIVYQYLKNKLPSGDEVLFMPWGKKAENPFLDKNKKKIENEPYDIRIQKAPVKKGKKMFRK
jgi:ankyrin repeat protein